MKDIKHKVPQEISKLTKILWFEVDEVFVFLFPLTIMFLLRLNVPYAAIMSAAFCYIYMIEKSKHARGFIFHIGFIYGLANFEGFESNKVREYWE